MIQETIVFTPGREVPSDILDLGQRMKPAGFTLQMMPPNASAADIVAMLREAEGIDMEFVRARPSGVVPHTENPAEVNPILGHVAFEEARVSIYRA
jgi:hypothetical protein